MIAVQSRHEVGQTELHALGLGHLETFLRRLLQRPAVIRLVSREKCPDSPEEILLSVTVGMVGPQLPVDGQAVGHSALVK